MNSQNITTRFEALTFSGLPRNVRLLFVAFVLLFSTMIVNAGLVPDTVSEGEDNLVRAKLGLKIIAKEEARRAKSKDKLNVGDELQIHVYPDRNAHIYIIHTDQKKVTLLNKEHYLIEGGVGLVMPSNNQFYQVDGLAKKEIITIVVSDKALKSIEELDIHAEGQYEEWVDLEAVLTKQGKVRLSDDLDKPFSIAGNVRGAQEQPFWESLKTYTGKSILLKKYEFKVKK